MLLSGFWERGTGFQGAPKSLHEGGGLLRAVRKVDGELGQGSGTDGGLIEGGTDDAQPEEAACEKHEE